jgi:hypothetical protein
MRRMLIALLAACGDDDTAPVQACEIPAPVQSDASVSCTFARGYLTCGNCGCATEDRATCSYCSGGCKNVCANGEYEATCGGSPVPGGRTFADPPAACHAMLILPSGTSIYCCPCS